MSLSDVSFSDECRTKKTLKYVKIMLPVFRAVVKIILHFKKGTFALPAPLSEGQEEHLLLSAPSPVCLYTAYCRSETMKLKLSYVREFSQLLIVATAPKSYCNAEKQAT